MNRAIHRTDTVCKQTVPVATGVLFVCRASKTPGTMPPETARGYSAAQTRGINVSNSLQNVWNDKSEDRKYGVQWTAHIFKYILRKFSVSYSPVLMFSSCKHKPISSFLLSCTSCRKLDKKESELKIHNAEQHNI